MKKWLFPIASMAIIILMILGSMVCGALFGEYGGAVVVFCAIILFVLIIVPIRWFSYSKRCLRNQKFLFLFTLYNSFCFVLPYFLIFIRDDETILYSLIFWGWCELWSLLGLIHKNQEIGISWLDKKYKGKNNHSNYSNDSNGSYDSNVSESNGWHAPR